MRNVKENVMKKASVFLGGTCGDSTWRNNIIRLLLPDVDIINPQKAVGEWNKDDDLNEIRQRRDCDITLYTIASLTSALSIAEVVDDSHIRPYSTICCMLCNDEYGCTDAITKMIERNGVIVANNINDASIQIKDMAKKLMMLTQVEKDSNEV
jgi:hypothetical protein